MPIKSEEFDCKNMLSQAEMTACAHIDYQKADKELNLVWPRVKEALKNWDQNLDHPLNISSQRLLDAQRAWILFRDAHCDVQALQWAGGTGQAMIGSMCRAELTRERTTQLKSILEEG